MGAFTRSGSASTEGSDIHLSLHPRRSLARNLHFALQRLRPRARIGGYAGGPQGPKSTLKDQ